MNQRSIRWSLLPLLLLSVACASTDTPTPQVRQVGHRTIAVLPFEMVYQGKAPAGLTGQQIQRLEEGESLAFQASLYLQLQRRAGQNPRGVEIQPVDVTNQILADHRISIRDSWQMPAEALARTLRVDAVVRTRIEKTRYLADLESYGIDGGGRVVNAAVRHATRQRVDLSIPYGLSKTHNVFVAGALLSGRDGGLLWRVAVYRETDWTRPADDVIEGLTQKLARSFPDRT